jgi:SAM-dependent methyltransferase
MVYLLAILRFFVLDVILLEKEQISFDWRIGRWILDILYHNREAWNKQVQQGNRWTVPVSSDEIAEARKGRWNVLLTPTRPVPFDWFPPITDLDILCLACGGGQQGPILAAAGANVTVFDNSPAQLEQDRKVATREGLHIMTVQGDMADLSVFPQGSFDLIFHPCSNNFSAEVRPVWKEAYRVLRPGGSLFAGFGNPFIYIFDSEQYEKGILEVKYSLPYSDLESLSDEQKRRFVDDGEPFEFSHTLEDQIGGQLEAGFFLVGFYEDRFSPEDNDLLNRYLPTFIATRSIKGTKTQK